MKYFITFIIFFSMCSVSAQEWTVYTTENSPLPSNRVLCVAVGPDEAMWIGTIDAGLVKFDGSWTVYNMENSGIAGDAVSVIRFDSDGDLWCGTPYGLCQFNGSTWKTHLPGMDIRALDFDGFGNVWAGNMIPRMNGLLKYDGQNWVEFGAPHMIFDIDTNDSTVWVCTGNLIEFDYHKWTVFDDFNENTGVPTNGVRSVLVDGQTVWCGTSELGLFMTQDESEWISYASEMPSGRKNIHVIKKHMGNLWVGTSGGVCILDEKGTWTKYDTDNSPLRDNRVRSFSFINNSTWIGTTEGLYVLTEPTATATVETPFTLPPTQFELFQNFPNPFNGNTTIQFNISEKSNTTLTLYNILGQHIETILDGELKPGVYASQLRGDNLTSGAYFITLSTNTQRTTKKIIVLN